MGFEEWGSILLSSAKREKKLCGLYGLSSRKTGNPKTNVTLNMDFNGCHLRDTCLQQEKPAKLGVRRERQQDGEKVGLQSLKHDCHAVGSRQRSNIQEVKDVKIQI